MSMKHVHTNTTPTLTYITDEVVEDVKMMIYWLFMSKVTERKNHSVVHKI